MTLHKTIALALGLGASVLVVQAQRFNNTSAVPRVLQGSTNFYSTCASPGTKSITFSVSGLSNLNSSDNQLVEIDLRLRSATDKYNLSNLTLFLKSPSGTCAQVATRMGQSNAVATNRDFHYKFRSPQSCLNKSPDYQTGGSMPTQAVPTASSMYGVFSTTMNLATAFNGENPNGTWTLYFGRNDNCCSFFPDAMEASLLFGQPEITNHSSSGNTCVTAVPWDGGPICLSTTGKTPDGNSPGWNGGSYTAGCAWNNSNDNNIWVSFQPTSSTVCVNVSGIIGAGLQSIIVTDPNSDGDNNPCTPTTNGTYWTTVSCPRTSNQVYGELTGTPRSHNHCFTATPGQTYYIVIDGNAGSESDFYLTGISGLPTILPVSLTSFTATCTPEGTLLNWETATELNNDFFTIETGTDGENWTTLTTVSGSGTTNTPTRYEWLDRGLQTGMVYYRLAQTDYDGTHEKLKIAAAFCSQENQVLVVPNPSEGDFRVTGLQVGDVVFLKDMNGREVFKAQADSQTAHVVLDSPQAGCYFLQVVRLSGETETHKVLVR